MMTDTALIKNDALFLLGHILPQDGARIAYRGNDSALITPLKAASPACQIVSLKSKASDSAEGYDFLIHDYLVHDPSRIADDLSRLKDDGVFLTRGPVLPCEDADERYVMFETDNTAQAGALEDFAAQNGAFIEQLPPRFPGTSLFRLSLRSVYEFLCGRSFDRLLSLRAQQDTLSAAGLLPFYSAPHGDDFPDDIRLYDEAGQPQPLPARHHIILARKTDRELPREGYSRDPQQTPPLFTIKALRHIGSGALYDIITPEKEAGRDRAEILPYYQDESGVLYIYLDDQSACPLMTAAPRHGHATMPDGRQWRGLMPQAVSVPTALLERMDETAVKDVTLFARDHLSLKPESNALLETGPLFFPAPDMLDEQIATRYLRVQPRHSVLNARRADHILAAITHGALPQGRLHAQITALMDRLNSTPPLFAPPAAITTTITEILPALMEHDLGADDPGYRPARGSAGQWRSVSGRFDDTDLTFALPAHHLPVRAVLLPLARNRDGALCLGTLCESLPASAQFAAQRPRLLRLPEIALPPPLSALTPAREMIAARHGLSLKDVVPLPFNSYPDIALTPLRFLTFAITAPLTDMRYASLPTLRHLTTGHSNDELFMAALGLVEQWDTQGNDAP